MFNVLYCNRGFACQRQSNQSEVRIFKQAYWGGLVNPLGKWLKWLILRGNLTRRRSLISRHPISIWVFPKIGVPQNGWFIMENPIKMIWGYHYLRKHPSLYNNDSKWRQHHASSLDESTKWGSASIRSSCLERCFSMVACKFFTSSCTPGCNIEILVKEGKDKQQPDSTCIYLVS